MVVVVVPAAAFAAAFAAAAAVVAVVVVAVVVVPARAPASASVPPGTPAAAALAVVAARAALPPVWGKEKRANGGAHRYAFALTTHTKRWRDACCQRASSYIRACCLLHHNTQTNTHLDGLPIVFNTSP
jgi:hypothetical protein